jgi:hypothetical protein
MILTGGEQRKEIFMEIAMKIMDHPQFQGVLNVEAVQDEWLEVTERLVRKTLYAMYQFEVEVSRNGIYPKSKEAE